MRERRQYVRVPDHSKVTYRIVSYNKTEGFLARNISQGGISFFVKEFIPVGTILEIRLTLEKIVFSFEARVSVKWTKEHSESQRFEVGVEFVNIPQKAQEHLVRYIKNII